MDDLDFDLRLALAVERDDERLRAFAERGREVYTRFSERMDALERDAPERIEYTTAPDGSRAAVFPPEWFEELSTEDANAFVYHIRMVLHWPTVFEVVVGTTRT